MSNHVLGKNQNRKENLKKRTGLLHQMKAEMPQYKELLDFYEPVLEERKKFKSALRESLHPNIADDPGYYQLQLEKHIPLVAKTDVQFDNKVMIDHLIKLLQILRARTQNVPGIFLDRITRNKNFSFEAIFNESFLSDAASTSKESMPAELIDFLVNEMINPVLEIYAEKIRDQIELRTWDRGICPVCGEKPALAALTKDEGKRILICSSCSTEWKFSRIKCPYCGNHDQQQMSYLLIEKDEKYRIELCDGCRRYLKTIDLRKTTHDVCYDIENIITCHLDIIALNKGYSDRYPLAPPAVQCESRNFIH
ncbi:MAG: formate dehydrogenase accessory protein FdhE [Desulfobacteraceae bacterium]|nr:MAG: formate dehydrogenase accessory protein FdhE [Desulfobacteraceae bacterium]